jgi:hypothetical protein
MGLTREDYRRAAEHGVSAQLLCRRIRFGWELERAITQTPKPVVPADPELVKWRELANANGIKRTVFMDRIRAGWPPERAATEMVRRWERMYP